MTASTSLPKWQLALVVGTPVVIGLSYLYYKKKKNNDNNKILSNGKNAKNKSHLSSDEISQEDSEAKLNRAEECKNEGNKQFKLANYRKAIAHYEEAIKLCPMEHSKKIAIFYQNKAAAYEHLQSYENVQEDCTKALELDSHYTKALVRRARASEKLGQLEFALDDVSTACVFESFNNPVSLVLADRILEKLGKQHAEEDMRTKNYIFPSKHYMRTYIASFSKDPIFSKIDDMDVKDIPQYLRKLLQALKDQNYESIKSMCTEILKNAIFDTPSSKMEIALLEATFNMFSDKYDNVLELFNNIINSNDSSNDVKINALIKRANLYYQYNHIDKALCDFEDAITIDPQCPDIYYHRGQFHLFENNLELAVDDFKKTFLYNPHCASSLVKKYCAAYRMIIKDSRVNEIEELLTNFNECFEKFPDCAEAYIFYAQVMSDLNQHEKANEYFTKALAKDPHNANIYVHKGILQLQFYSNTSKTIEYIKQAIKMDSKCEFAYEALGSVEVQKGNLNEAIRLFGEAVRLSRTFRQLTHLFSLMDAAKIQRIIKIRLGNLKQ